MKKLIFLLIFSSFVWGQGAQLPKYKVSTLPTASLYPTYTVQVTDGLTAIDCTSGGGTFNVLCTSHGGAWNSVAQASGTTTNPLTMNNSGSGAASGTTFNGSAAQTISYNTIGAAPTASPTFTGTVTMPAPTLNNVTGSTQCLHANSSGVVSGTGSDCGSGGGTPGGTSGQLQFNNASAFGGTGGITFPGTSGMLNGVATDTYTGATTYGYQTWLLNGLDPSAQYSVDQPGNSVSAIIAGEAIPNTGTNHQAQALAAYVTNSSTSVNAVGAYLHARCLANSTKCWASNPIVSDATGLSSGVTMFGEEVDLNANNAADTVYGIGINGVFAANATSSHAIDIASLGSFKWGAAFVSHDGAATNGVDIGATASSGTAASQPLILRTRSGSFSDASTITADTGGNFLFTPFNSHSTFTGTIALTDASCTSGTYVKGDNTGCGSGGSGLSGQTAGQVPIAATATTSTSSKAIQGTDTNLLSSGTVSGTGQTLCTDANGGATTSGCTGSATSVPLCADISGSGTAQSCTTSPSFTPSAGSSIIYTTTTANTGTGLTINVNSLGAKSVAKWQTTTTLAANDMRANTQVLLTYDGTNWEISTIGNAPSSSSGTSGWVFEPFYQNASTTNPIGIFGFTGATTSGTISAPLTPASSTAGHNGIWQFDGGTGTNSHAEIFSSNKAPAAYLNTGAGSFKVAAEVYTVPQSNGTMSFGIATGTSGPNPTNGAGFSCDPNDHAGSTHWWFAGTGTAVDTGVSCSSVWHQLEVSVSNLTMTGYIDGTSVGTDSVTAGNYLIYASSWSHTSGGGDSLLQLDWVAANENVPSTLN